MSLVWSYNNNDNEPTEMVDRVRVGAMALVTHAEQATVGSSNIPLDDPLATFEIRGHRIIGVVETSIDEDEDPAAGVVWVGYSAQRGIKRDEEQTDDARAYQIAVVDINTVFDRRILRGSDCNRPAETDVERIQWLAGTSEASLIDDTSLLSTADPVDMDAVDYRDQKLTDVVRDCMDQSGKNCFLTWLQHPTLGGNDIVFSIWYGHDSVEAFTSPIQISNFADDDNETIFAPSPESKLNRSPDRVFSGVVVAYDGGSVYVTRAETATTYALGGRDTTLHAPNVKTEATAIRRGERFLADVATEEDVITTSIVVRGSQVNQLMAGHRVQARFQHLPGDFDANYSVLTWFRVMNRTVHEASIDVYEIAVELSPVTDPAPTGTGGGGDVYGILVDAHAWSPAGTIVFEHEGGAPFAGTGETTGLISAVVDATKPDNRDHTGWLIEGDGEIDLVFHASATGVRDRAIDDTVTWAIRKNGAIAASEVVSIPADGSGPFPWSGSATVSVTGLSVADGDVITATVGPPTPHGMWFFTVPAGVGDLSGRLEITGGSLV